MWPALLATAVAAGAATLVLRPRSGLIEPAAIELTAYFSPAELERSADFRDVQRVLSLAGVALSGVDARGARPAPAADPQRGVAAAGVSVALVVVGLPLGDLAPRAGGRRGALHPVDRALAGGRGEVGRDRRGLRRGSAARW